MGGPDLMAHVGEEGALRLVRLLGLLLGGLKCVLGGQQGLARHERKREQEGHGEEMTEPGQDRRLIETIHRFPVADGQVCCEQA